MSAIDDMLERARRGRVPPSMPPEPAKGLAIVTCMDARVMPEAIFGLRPGEAHVVRNAGGIVTDDVVRSVLVSQQAMGTRAVMVIQHSQCGMLGLDDHRFKRAVRERLGRAPVGEIGGFDDHAQRLRASRRALERAGLAAGEVRTFVYDIDDGSLVEYP